MRRSNLRFISILALGWLVNPALGSEIIDFEDWTGGTGDQTSIAYGGFNFSTNGAFFIAPDPDGGNPSLSLHMRSGVLEVSKVDGGSFSIVSLDLQEGLLANPSTYVTLTGFFTDIVKEPFFLDGLADTYETFYPTGFIGIDRLDLYAGGPSFSLDNIAIPEPMTLCMLVLALCLPHKPRF